MLDLERLLFEIGHIQVLAKNSTGMWLEAGEVKVPLVAPIKPMTFVLSHEPSK